MDTTRLKTRNYVARAKQSGAGKHKDKRQQLKHKEVYDASRESREEARATEEQDSNVGSRGSET